MEKIRVGILGMGRGQTFASPHESIGFEVRAICDTYEGKVTKWLEKLGGNIKGYKPVRRAGRKTSASRRERKRQNDAGPGDHRQSRL